MAIVLSGTTNDITVDGVSVATDAEVSSAVASGVAPKANTSDLKEIGVGQTWQDLTASRVAGTTYTNSTGKPIQLAIDITVTVGTIATLTIGANTFFYRGSLGTAVGHTIELIVQNGVTYNLSSSNVVLNKWQELR